MKKAKIEEIIYRFEFSEREMKKAIAKECELNMDEWDDFSMILTPDGNYSVMFRKKEKNK